MNIKDISKLPYEQQQIELNKKIIPVISTETKLRKWQRRLIVALTNEEKQKCRAKIREYSNEYKNNE